jgi:hypothetical protein
MAPILAPLLGVLFLRGHISLKNWTYCPVLRVSATPFKSTCLLTMLEEVPERTVLRVGPYLIMEEQPVSTLTRGAESNPARVLWREAWQD